MIVEKLAHFIQRESAILSALQNGEPRENSAIVAPLAAGSHGLWEQSNALVISNCRGAQAGSFRNLTDGHDQRLSLLEPSAEIGLDEFLDAFAAGEAQPERAVFALQT